MRRECRQTAQRSYGGMNNVSKAKFLPSTELIKRSVVLRALHRSFFRQTELMQELLLLPSLGFLTDTVLPLFVKGQDVLTRGFGSFGGHRCNMI